MRTSLQKEPTQPEIRIVRVFLLMGTVQSLLSAFAGPLFLATRHTVAAGIVYYSLGFGSPKNTAETFYWQGFPLALDDKWFGFFLGMLIGLLIYQSATERLAGISPQRFKLIRGVGLTVSAVTLGLFVAESTGGYLYGIFPVAAGFASGLGLGFVLPFFLVPFLAFCLILIRRSIKRFFATSHHINS